MQINLIVAGVHQGKGVYGIGLNGSVPWRLPPFEKRFNFLTANKTLIMGRRTWASNVFHNHHNIFIVSRTLSLNLPNVSVVSTVRDAMEDVRISAVDEVWIVGGPRIFDEVLLHAYTTDQVWLTLTDVAMAVPALTDLSVAVHTDVAMAVPALTDVAVAVHTDVAMAVPEFDTYFKLPDNSSLIREDGEYKYENITYRHQLYSIDVIVEEQQYIDLCQHILNHGNRRDDRTGVGTLSVFGHQMRFSLEGGKMPLLTVKHVFWRGVVEELLWFISGSTDVTVLQKKRVYIWDANAESAHGDLGPIYGHQWRHFGAAYPLPSSEGNRGVDQLAECIRQIREEPTSRRIVMSAWNPVDIPRMALPPCHVMAQWYVHDGKLSCQVYQRSCDMGLGVPFNIASYSLLTHLMANVCELDAYELVYTMGDAHVYLNHVDALRDLLTRPPRPCPTVTVTHKSNIDEFTFDDIQLIGYDPWPVVAMDMAV